MRWIRFFLGTPRRALASLVALAAMVALEYFAPGTIGRGLAAVGTQILAALLELVNRFFGPVAWAVLPLVIVGIGFRIMARGFGRRR